MKPVISPIIVGALLPLEPLISVVDHDSTEGPMRGPFFQEIVEAWRKSFRPKQSLSEDEVTNRLYEAASRYLDRDAVRFNAVPRSIITAREIEIQSAVARLLEILDDDSVLSQPVDARNDLSKPSRATESGLVRADVSNGIRRVARRLPYRGDAAPQTLSAVVLSLRLLQDATDERLVIESTALSGRPEIRHVHNLIASLADIWSDCANRPFPKSVATTPNGREFTSPAAFTVYTVARAIDDSIQLGAVRSSIRRLKRTKSADS
jgi:hypothetical protein